MNLSSLARYASDTLVMRGSLGDDEYRGTAVPTVVRDRRRRARRVPVDPGAGEHQCHHWFGTKKPRFADTEARRAIRVR